MAKSFHEIIESGEFEVKHGSEYADFLLPAVLADLKGRLMDVDKLDEWAVKHDIKLAVYHSAIQKAIIDARQKGRPGDLKGVNQSMLADLAGAQDRIDGFELKPTLPPGSSKPKAFAKGEETALVSAVEAMKLGGLDSDTIVTILGAKFDPAKVQMVLDGLVERA